MTGNELYTAIASLEHETSLDMDAVFFTAANVSIATISEEFPQNGVCVIYHDTPKVNLADTRIRHLSGDTGDHFTGDNVVSVSYKIHKISSGTAVITLKDRSGNILATQTADSDTKYSYICSEKQRVTIEFGGTGSYIIVYYALYSEKYSDSVDDVPEYKEKTEYNIAEIATRYIRIANEGVYKNGVKAVKGIDYDIVNDNTISVEENGEYVINYEKQPSKLTEDNMDNAIELPAKTINLLPLLCAYYCYLYYDDSKSVHFYNRYIDMMNIISERTSGVSEEAVIIRR